MEGIQVSTLDKWLVVVYFLFVFGFGSYFGRYIKNFTADDGYCTLFDTASGNALPTDCTGPGATVPAGGVNVGEGLVDDDDTAWGVGVEAGSSTKWLKLGFGYFHIQTNAIMSMFGDSDLLDGFTNRQGWVAYGSRTVARNTELKLAYYTARHIESDAPLARSVFLSKRSRLQTDIIFKF